MKRAMIDVDPQIAHELFGVLRDAGIKVCHSLPPNRFRPGIRVVIEGDSLPSECEGAQFEVSARICLVECDGLRNFKLEGFVVVGAYVADWLWIDEVRNAAQ